jgi:hypothetical protein
MLAHATIKMRIMTGDFNDNGLSISYKAVPLGTTISRDQRRDIRNQFKKLLRQAHDTLDQMWEVA